MHNIGHAYTYTMHVTMIMLHTHLCTIILAHNTHPITNKVTFYNNIKEKFIRNRMV